MSIKDKITSLLKEQGKSLRDLAISIGTTENGLHYMFKNNSFKFDTIEKASEYLNVDISFFSDNKLTSIEHKNSTKKDLIGKKKTENDNLTSVSLNRDENIKKINILELLMLKSNTKIMFKEFNFCGEISDFIKDYISNYHFSEFEELHKEIDVLISKNKTTGEITAKMLPKFINWKESSKIDIDIVAEFNKHLKNFFEEIDKSLPEDDDNLKPLVEIKKMMYSEKFN